MLVLPDIKEIKIPKNTEQVFFGFSKGFGLAGQETWISLYKRTT